MVGHLACMLASPDLSHISIIYIPSVVHFICVFTHINKVFQNVNFVKQFLNLSLFNEIFNKVKKLNK